jgi:hypothetical protein
MARHPLRRDDRRTLPPHRDRGPSRLRGALGVAAIAAACLSLEAGPAAGEDQPAPTGGAAVNLVATVAPFATVTMGPAGAVTTRDSSVPVVVERERFGNVLFITITAS